MSMSKIKVSQDALYQYLQEHNITKVIIARKMGVSESIVGGCFRHALNRHGKPLKFSAANIVRLNDAIHQIASELRECIIPFGSEQAFVNRNGKTYDPAALKTISRVGGYFVMNMLTERLLGWKKTRCGMVLSVKSSGIYGHVSQDDVNRLNAELLSVAGVLGSYEVVPDDNGTITT